MLCTFIALFYRKVFGARGKEISVGIGRNVFPHLGAAKSLLFGEVMRKEKKYKFLSDTQLTAAGSHWRDFRCHVPANRTGYWLRCVLGRSSWAPFFPPISFFSLGASHAFIELYSFLWRRKVLHNRIWISGITGKVFLRGCILQSSVEISYRPYIPQVPTKILHTESHF